MSYVQWIPEKIAAEIVQLKPRTLRRHVTSGKWGKVKYRTINGRSYQYDERDLNRIDTPANYKTQNND